MLIFLNNINHLFYFEAFNITAWLLSIKASYTNTYNHKRDLTISNLFFSTTRTQAAEKQVLALNTVHRSDQESIDKLKQQINASQERVGELDELKSQLELQLKEVQSKLQSFTGETPVSR